MNSIGYGRVGKPVRLYDGFLEKRRLVETRLREAGLSDADLAGWAADRAGGTGSLEVSLQEAGFAGSVEDREELLQEAGSTSDFGAYLSDKATKRLMGAYEDAPSSWRQYARTYSVPDFKPISFVRLAEMEDLLPIPEGGPYPDQPLPEIEGPTVTIGTFGRTFTLSRRAIINDDLNQLSDRPAALGRATARTIARDAIGKLEENPTAYDGTEIFHANHGNLISGTISEDNVGKLTTGLRRQRDDNGNPLSLRPQALIAPPELELVAQRIVNSTAVPLAGYAPGDTRTEPRDFGVGGANVIAAAIRNVVIEDYLTDAEDFYIVGDPQIAPGIAVGFLLGKETPDVFLKDPGMRNVLGTSDPYSMEYDEIAWKVRHDWGTAFLDWRGWQKSAN